MDNRLTLEYDFNSTKYTLNDLKSKKNILSNMDFDDNYFNIIDDEVVVGKKELKLLDTRDRTDIISRFFKAMLDNHGNISKNNGVISLECDDEISQLSHKDIIQILKKYNNYNIQDMADLLVSIYDEYKDGMSDRTLKAINEIKICSNEKIRLEKYDIIVKCNLNTDGIISQTEIIDLNTYTFGDEDEEYISENLEEFSNKFWKGFYTIFSFIPEHGIMPLDIINRIWVKY